MPAVYYIVDTLCSLYIGVYILRFLMQLVRADFRNEVSSAIVKLTNPLILPLRRVLPPISKIDTASVVAILLLTAGKIALLRLIFGAPLPSLIGWIWLVVLNATVQLLWVLFWCIVLSALINLLTQGARTVITYLLDAICEPVLRPFRRYIPSVAGGFDLSYLWATIAIQALIILINTTFLPRF